MNVEELKVQPQIKRLTPTFKGDRNFWNEQMAHLREGGWFIFIQKIYTLLILPWAIIAVAVIRLLRPLVIIRFGILDLARLGSLYTIFCYLSEQKGGKHKGFWDLFYLLPNCPILNHHWLIILKRYIYICPFKKLAHTIVKLNHLLPGSAVHVIRYPHPPDKETFNYIKAYNQPLFSFTVEEEVLGQEKLQELGIRPGASFICFHTRDSAFLKTYFPGKNWSYHDYRDTSIHTYRMAIEKLVSKGYFAVRMGAAVKEKFHSDNPAIIDYATNGKRTDFLDIYLGAKCKFFIGSDSGITVIPESFKRPMIYTNWVSIQFLPVEYYHFALIIMKKWYSIKEERFLTFREILKYASPHCIRPDELGVKFIDNTPEEIVDIVYEMEERLKGTWTTTKEDEQLQKAFWAIYEKNNIWGPGGSNKLQAEDVRIGAKFLRQNQNLLD